MRTGIWGALAVGAALAVTGCGGGSKSLNKSDLDAKVNKICKDTDAQQNKIKPPSDFATNPKAAADYLTAIQKVEKDGISQLKGLKPDDSVKADYNAYLADNDHALALLDTALSKAKAKDASGLKDVQTLGNYLTNTVRPLEKKLGFTDCNAGG
jgi:hypothetical protein